jgi:hypothetical protein
MWQASGCGLLACSSMEAPGAGARSRGPGAEQGQPAGTPAGPGAARGRGTTGLRQAGEVVSRSSAVAAAHTQCSSQQAAQAQQAQPDNLW